MDKHICPKHIFQYLVNQFQLTIGPLLNFNLAPSFGNKLVQNHSMKQVFESKKIVSSNPCI